MDPTFDLVIPFNTHFNSLKLIVSTFLLFYPISYLYRFSLKPASDILRAFCLSEVPSRISISSHTLISQYRCTDLGRFEKPVYYNITSKLLQDKAISWLPESSGLLATVAAISLRESLKSMRTRAPRAIHLEISRDLSCSPRSLSSPAALNTAFTRSSARSLVRFARQLARHVIPAIRSQTSFTRVFLTD